MDEDKVTAVRLGESEYVLGQDYKSWRTPDGDYAFVIRWDGWLTLGDLRIHHDLCAVAAVQEEGCVGNAARARFSEVLAAMKDPESPERKRVQYAGVCNFEGSVTRWTVFAFPGLAEPNMKERGEIHQRLCAAVRRFDGYRLPGETSEIKAP